MLCFLDFRRFNNHAWIFEIELPEAPAVEVDHREVIDAVFLTPAEALPGLLSPIAWHYLENRTG